MPKIKLTKGELKKQRDALKQYQREWDEDKKAFREKPRHDWTSHPADAFRMLAVAWQHEAPKAKTQEPMRGITVGANTATLDELWRTAPKSSAAIAKIVKDPQFGEQLKGLGLEIVGSDRAELDKFRAGQRKSITEIVKISGVDVK